MAKSAAFSREFVRRLTADARHELWQAGVSLQESPGWFAAPSSIGRYRGLLAANPPEIAMPTEPAPDFASGILGVFDALKPNMDFYAERRAAWEGMQAETAARIRSGELLALGFVVPRQVDDAPAPIPPDVWSGKIEWGASKVSGEGLEFVSVRITAPQTAVELLPQPETDREQRRPVGRPSTKAEVFAAYEALRDSGKVDFSGSMRQLYPEIRLWLSVTHPDRSGIFENLSDEAIRQVITDAFKADRAAKKQ